MIVGYSSNYTMPGWSLQILGIHFMAYRVIPMIAFHGFNVHVHEHVYMFICLCHLRKYICIVYVVKEVTSFREG